MMLKWHIADMVTIHYSLLIILAGTKQIKYIDLSRVVHLFYFIYHSKDIGVMEKKQQILTLLLNT